MLLADLPAAGFAGVFVVVLLVFVVVLVVLVVVVVFEPAAALLLGAFALPDLAALLAGDFAVFALADFCAADFDPTALCVVDLDPVAPCVAVFDPEAFCVADFDPVLTDLSCAIPPETRADKATNESTRLNPKFFIINSVALLLVLAQKNFANDFHRRAACCQEAVVKVFKRECCAARFLVVFF